MTKYKKPKFFSKLSNGIKRAKANLQLEKSELIDVTIPINKDQNISLEGCEVLTDHYEKKSMIKNCDVKITSNKIITQRSNNPQGHKIAVDLEHEENNP